VAGDGSELWLSDIERRAQRPAHRRRAARAQRAGWALLALVVLAALAGLLGPGPLSSATLTAPSGRLTLTYERFIRRTGQTHLELRIRTGPAHPGQARAWISARYLSGFDVEHVLPQPDGWTATGVGLLLTVRAGGPGEEVPVRVRLRPNRIGLVHGAVGVPGEEPVEFWQFVYP